MDNRASKWSCSNSIRLRPPCFASNGQTVSSTLGPLVSDATLHEYRELIPDQQVRSSSATLGCLLAPLLPSSHALWAF